MLPTKARFKHQLVHALITKTGGFGSAVIGRMIESSLVPASVGYLNLRNAVALQISRALSTKAKASIKNGAMQQRKCCNAQYLA